MYFHSYFAFCCLKRNFVGHSVKKRSPGIELVLYEGQTNPGLCWAAPVREGCNTLLNRVKIHSPGVDLVLYEKQTSPGLCRAAPVRENSRASEIGLRYTHLALTWCCMRDRLAQASVGLQSGRVAKPCEIGLRNTHLALSWCCMRVRLDQASVGRLQSGGLRSWSISSPIGFSNFLGM